MASVHVGLCRVLTVVVDAPLEALEPAALEPAAARRAQKSTLSSKDLLPVTVLRTIIIFWSGCF